HTGYQEIKTDTVQREALHQGASDPTLASVIGTVRWKDQQPAAAVDVLLLHDYTGALLASTLTDAEGRYRLEVPAEVEHEELDMYQVLCPGYAAAENYYTAMPDITPDRVDILLFPGFDLQIRATYQHDGSPAEGVFLTLYDENHGDSEVMALTDASGLANLHMPQEGAWNCYATMGGYFGPDTSPFAIHWIEAETGVLEISIAPLPDAVSLRAIDAATGAPLHQAVFRAATSPDDLRDLEPLGLAALPTGWSGRNGRLDLQFRTPGRAYFHVEAPGYLPEIVEWVSNDGRTHDVPLLPLRSIPVRVTEHGKPTQATVITAVNTRTMVKPSGAFFEEVAAHPHTGGPRPQETDALGALDLSLPDPDVPTAPQAFDLWMETSGKRKYFGTLSWERMPEPPWHFEMAPPTGQVVLEVNNTEGKPLADLSFHISSDIDRSAFDSIRMGQYGRQSTILKTDSQGRAVVRMPTPADIRIAGSGVQGTEHVAMDGRLESDETLIVPILLDRPAEQEELLQTHGRIEFLGEDWAAGKRSLWVRYQTLDPRPRAGRANGVQALHVEDDLSFEMWLPQGRYRLWSADESLELAMAGNRTVMFQAGEEDVTLRLPVPQALKVRAIDARTLEGVRLNDVTMRSPSGREWSMDSWEGDFALSYIIFEEEVEVLLQARGHALTFQRVPLKKGVLTEVTIPMESGRKLPIRIEPSSAVREELHLHWLDAPGARSPYVLDARTWVWEHAPTGAAHLRAYLDGQPLHDIHLNEESTEIIIDLGASQYFPPENE
ncbi:MAG: hypothetical protein ACPG31_06280, partial [Planctomycetota bacterium]